MPESITVCPPPDELNAPVSVLSIYSNVTSFPSIVGNFKRAVSYKLKTDACTFAEVPPFVKGDKLLPSIFIGRPSLTFAKTLIASPSCT